MATSEILSPGTNGDFGETRAALSKARHLPGYIYTSPEVYQLEKDKVFMKDWLCVGRMEEVENPGDYMALRVLDEPIIVARDTAGKVNAFANVCQHRGVEVAVLEEDREMVDSMQRGMASRMFHPGPLSRMEVNLHSLINYNLDRIFDEA